jgi:hypothetical protein
MDGRISRDPFSGLGTGETIEIYAAVSELTVLRSPGSCRRYKRGQKLHPRCVTSAEHSYSLTSRVQLSILAHEIKPARPDRCCPAFSQLA